MEKTNIHQLVKKTPGPRGDRGVHNQEATPPRPARLDVERTRLRLPAAYTPARGPRRDQGRPAAPWPPPGRPATPGPPPHETAHTPPGPRGTARNPREHTPNATTNTFYSNWIADELFDYIQTRDERSVTRKSSSSVLLDSRQVLSDSRQAFLDSRRTFLVCRPTFSIG